jgi:IS5 family transposase
MKQLGLDDSGFVKKSKRTRKQQFLEEMDKVIPWEALLRLIETHYPKAGNGRPPLPMDGLPPVRMTLPGYDSSIGGSDEQPTLYADSSCKEPLCQERNRWSELKPVC